jgi:hypothetical protein
VVCSRFSPILASRIIESAITSGSHTARLRVRFSGEPFLSNQEFGGSARGVISAHLHLKRLSTNRGQGLVGHEVVQAFYLRSKEEHHKSQVTFETEGVVCYLVTGQSN